MNNMGQTEVAEAMRQWGRSVQDFAHSSLRASAISFLVDIYLIAMQNSRHESFLRNQDAAADSL